MSRNPSVAKGNRFERELAEILSRWSGVPLRKTPRDGDWAKAMYPGDVIPTIALNPQEWPFSFEAKDVKNFDLDSCTRSRKTGLTELLDNALDRRVDRLPILVAKKNRVKPTVFSPVLPWDCNLFFHHRIWWGVLPLDEFVKIPFKEMQDAAARSIGVGKDFQVGNHPASAVHESVRNGGPKPPHRSWRGSRGSDRKSRQLGDE